MTAAAALVAVLVLAVLPLPSTAQAGPDAPTDSAGLVERARERQREFERFRASRIPVERARPDGICDQRIGRMCIWFGGEGEEDFPPEPPETAQARRSLLAVLLETARAVKDPWVWGQLVHYMVEEGDFGYAEQVARTCGLAEPWWCSALLGYSLHVRGEFVPAEAAFREALERMPAAERRRWTSLRYLLPPGAVEEMDALDPPARERLWEAFWRFSDPLFLVEGNDRLTDHFARLVVARNRRDAEHPQGMEWDVDLEETLLRYGRTVGWSRTHDPKMSVGPRMSLQDTRRVRGHHHPGSRGYLFPEAFLESPADIPPESWITAPREARTWYAPPYAPDFEGLHSQVARFRRDGEMLVVAAYEPAPATPTETGGRTPGEPPAAPVRGPVEAALFLVPEEGADPVLAEGTEPGGVLTLRAEPGRYVSSLEVLDAPQRRAWRARQGVKQVALEPGSVGVSDLLILEEGAPFPGSLDDAVPHARRNVQVGRGERFTVAWEVYGLEVREPVEVTVGFTRGRPGFLARVGEFLGILEPDAPVEIRFTEEGPERVQTLFRAMVLELPDIEPGEHTLHVRLAVPGREPVVTSRPIVVVR